VGGRVAPSVGGRGSIGTQAIGSSQGATVGAAFGTALVAPVLDTYGNAVAGATFSLTDNVGPAPTVSSVSPNSVSRRSSYTVTVTGTNFRAGATVAFSGTFPVTVTSVTVVSATQLTVQVSVPTYAGTGNRSITVTNADRTSVAKSNAIAVTK
jgi:hypothetical protein